METTTDNNERCTFAIISHPDAGKTTMTEKLLWFGQVIRQVGMVKSKHNNFAKSDWMEMEKERGISVSSSVMSFPYAHRNMHLLDTPGHKDFSEDTYRTLTAVESVLMMIDSAKGVEAQTIKLMEVCRMRDTPIITFMNKLDRDSMGPFELMENLESILSIQCVPMTWPIGDGVNFKGVYNIKDKTIGLFDQTAGPEKAHIIDASDLSSPEVLQFIDDQSLIDQLEEDLEMIRELISPLDREEFLAGIQTPVYFGTALHNFGVKDVLDSIAELAPGPSAKEVRLPPFDETAPTRTLEPTENKFSAFIFKIQANMDKRHRDRVAFVRVCSGKFTRNQKMHHVRSGKDLKISAPLIFQAQDRNIIEEAVAGDIIGLHDTGKFQIGDSFSEGEKIQFTGIPSFSPEIFNKVLLKDPLKAKQLEKGLTQLSEEGTVQLFTRHTTREKILGAVGMLQFEVVKERLQSEYGVRGEYESYPFVGMRWPKFPDDIVKDQFLSKNSSNIVYDHKNRVAFSVRSEWDLKLVQDKFPTVVFFKNSDYR
jgi:peptide chain release factor 3